MRFNELFIGMTVAEDEVNAELAAAANCARHDTIALSEGIDKHRHRRWEPPAALASPCRTLRSAATSSQLSGRERAKNTRRRRFTGDNDAGFHAVGRSGSVRRDLRFADKGADAAARARCCRKRLPGSASLTRWKCAGGHHYCSLRRLRHRAAEACCLPVSFVRRSVEAKQTA